MNLLLDTQLAIWSVSASKRLADEARALIVDHGNNVFVSVASVWEISIKFPLGKRKDAPPFSAKQAVAHFEKAGFQLLEITAAHAMAVEALPPLHGDPFDRLLVAQALAEPLRLVTVDAFVARYSDTIILVPAKPA